MEIEGKILRKMVICFIPLLIGGRCIFMPQSFNKLRFTYFRPPVRYGKIIWKWHFKTNVQILPLVHVLVFKDALVLKDVTVRLTYKVSVLEKLNYAQIFLILTIAGWSLNFWVILLTESSGEITFDSLQYYKLNSFVRSLR